jgi:hypothetical protein
MSSSITTVLLETGETVGGELVAVSVAVTVQVVDPEMRLGWVATTWTMDVPAEAGTNVMAPDDGSIDIPAGTVPCNDHVRGTAGTSGSDPVTG